MSTGRKYIIIASCCLSITVFMTACNDSKTAQCERLIKEVNKGTELIEKSKGQQVTTSLKLAQDLKVVTQEIKDLTLKDPKLIDFQSRFVNLFETLSLSIAKAATALNSAKTAKASSEGRVVIQKARGDIDTALTHAASAAHQSDSLANQMNQHCK